MYGSRVTQHLSFDTNIEIYDLAGHSEYHSSHSAVLESLCLESPAVFVLLVDLTKSEEQLTKELYKWANFIEAQSSSISSHVIVLGSRRDQFSSKPDLLRSKCEFVEHCTKEALGNQHLAGFLPLDSRQLSSDNIQPFLQLLAKSVNDLIVPGVHEKISFGCYLLHAFLQKKVKERAIRLKEVQYLLAIELAFTHLKPVELASMLEIIANKGLLLFLRNSKDLSNSCIVIDKIRLLHEINGTLFAPSFFKEHCPIASNTGIVPLSRLWTIFPRYDPKVLVAFWTAMQLCRPLDPAVLSKVITNLSPKKATSEQLLYFPGLVSVERKSDLIIPGGHGWSGYCRNPRKCLTRRYNDSLFLDLAYSFSSLLPVQSKLEHEEQAVVCNLDRSCTVWKNGIHWSTEDGIQVMVQVTERNCRVSLSLSVDEEGSPRWLKLRSSLIHVILSKKEKLCPSVEFTEYLIHPSQLGLVSHKSLSQLSVFEMKTVIRCALLRSKFVLDVKQTERSSPSSLFLADPYLILHPKLVHHLFDSEKADQQVPSSFLREVCRQISSIPFLENMTYLSLQKQLNCLSIFAGRNPLVSVHVLWENMFIV